jgi:hypothetical protein
MKNNLRFACIFIIVCVAASCSRAPKDVLSEKKMRKVLYDMQMAEAMVETDRNHYRTNEEKQQLYDAVFAKHKIMQAEYDSSLIWYGENMDLYMRIYKLVLRDIEKNIEEMGDIKQDPLLEDMSAGDSLDIWIQRDAFAFEPENMYARLVFDIKPEIPYTQGSTYILGFDLWGLTPSMHCKPRVKLSAVQGDTIVTVNKEITEDGHFEAVLKTVEARPVNRIFGYVFINHAERYWRIYLDDIRLMKYNKSLEADTLR